MKTPWRQLRNALAAVVPTVKALTPEERQAAMKAERAAALKAASEAWEAQQRREHEAWIAAAQLDMQMRAEAARRHGTDNVGFQHAGEIPTINVEEGQWTDLFGRVRQFSNLGRWLGRR